MHANYEGIRKLILTPKDAWQEIEAEEVNANRLLNDYQMVLAIIPSISGFIGWLFAGESFFAAIVWAILSYFLILIGIWAFSKSLVFFASSFECTLQEIDAFKIATYGFTPFLLSGVFYIIPPLSWLAILGAYSLILACLGLSKFLHCASEKLIGMMISGCISMLVIYLIVIFLSMRLCGLATPFPA
ncbi:hypothetical protein JXJ21_11500 [candidate division KSB1 bacterium]|nr:hypothetical protein [candidate division KSB1 bacterium]